MGGHVKAVFTIITFIFVACVSLTITSFKEIPLWALVPSKKNKETFIGTNPFTEAATNYGTMNYDDDFESAAKSDHEVSI